MFNVDFKFKPGDYVKTDFDIKGRIEWCAIDSGNKIQYSVITSHDCNWYDEKNLTLWNEEN
jgi:hypothetical protein